MYTGNDQTSSLTNSEGQDEMPHYVAKLFAKVKTMFMDRNTS